MSKQLVVSRQIYIAGVDLNCGTPVYLDSQSRWQKAAANGTMASNIITSDTPAGSKAEGLTECNVDGFSGLTVGGVVYLANGEGITQTQPTIGQILGKAVSLTEIEFDVEPSTTEMTGATGLQGATGIRGVTGQIGITGLQGGTGTATGVQGITGLQGLTGIQGLTGLQGLTGIFGETGFQGITGVEGLAGGDTGLQGVTGVQGATGVGAQGITGVAADGVQGITGVQGLTGIQGLTGVLGGTAATGIAGITGAAPTADEFNTLVQALKDAAIMSA